MSIGTYRPNIFHRLGDAWSVLKGVPIQPGMLYPPRSNMGAGFLTWPGWDEYERRAMDDNQKDMQRAKTAVTSPWVFADVQAIANEFSTSTLIVKERIGTKLEDVDNHDLERIWESPNEHMGRSFVTAFWAWSYVLSSKAYLYWVPDTTGQALMEVWPIPPWMIRPVPDKDQFISGYAFKSSADSKPIIIPPELITYSHSVNLFDVRDGLSFLAAADTEIRADLAASAWNLNFFSDNNGVPDGLMAVGKDTLDQDVDRVRMELRDFFGGTKRGIAVARAGDLDYKEFGRSQKDMEFGNGRELASKVIGRTLGFPDGYWSDLANRANAEQARRTMISGAVWPLLVRLAEDMNAQKRGVVQRWYGDAFRVEFKDIRPEDNDMKLRQLQAYQPFLIVNELREMVGQEPLEDVRGLMLVAEINKGEPMPGTEAAEELDAIQAEKDEAAAQEAAAAAEASGEMPEEVDEFGEPVVEDAAVLPVEEEIPIKAVNEKAIAPLQMWIDEDKVQLSDLTLWERKSLKSFKRFKKADVAFETNAIPLPEQVRIHDALKTATTAHDIKNVFSGGMTTTQRNALAERLGDIGLSDAVLEERGHVKARDAVDTLLEDVDVDARAWVEEAETE